MSVALNIKKNIKSDVSDLVLATVKKGLGDVPEEYKAELDHMILKEVFGNIAYFQASESTTFPNFEKGMPEKKFGEGNPIKPKFNLKQVTDGIKMLSIISKNEAVRGATFRQMCAPFAEEAKEYLRELYNNEGDVSTLAQTLPKLCEKAPWVAFDFNRGLNFRKMSQVERGVVQGLARRLLCTQSKLMTTDAMIESQQGDIVA
uniref:Coat protein n=1 Tax=Agapanthus virus A TaxID=2838150 RepID=A0A8E7KPQ9_9VIRU|nr:coat protein [Agapanthus virus A]QVY19270.1 coat protein [Agapanthus virus A]